MTGAATAMPASTNAAAMAVEMRARHVFADLTRAMGTRSGHGGATEIPGFGYVATLAGVQQREREEEQRAIDETRRAARREMQAMLASDEPATVARGVSRMSAFHPRADAARAWEDYLRLAAPAAPFELVTLAEATGSRDPAEVRREPLWRHVHVETKQPPRQRVFYLDAGGDCFESLFDAPRTTEPVSQACVVKAGERLVFRRLGPGRGEIAVTNAVGVAPARAAAPTVLLVTLICVLAGIDARNYGSAWSTLSPAAAGTAT